MADVIIEHLVKDYPDEHGAVVRAVDDIGLKIGAGEFMMLVGPSSCGKSNTLRMIAGPETCLYLTTGAHNLDARMPAGFAHFVNRTLRLSLAVDRAHLFDIQIEEALT